MNYIIITLIVLVLLFGFVLLFGAPYVPTLKRQTEVSIELMGLKKGQTFLELGCGDGRVLRAAAKRGINGVGYELNPVMVLVAKCVTFRYRKQVKVVWGNFWRHDWPQADAVFVFLFERYMTRLDKRITAWHKRPVRLVSFAFTIPGKKPVRQKAGLFIYEYK